MHRDFHTHPQILQQPAFFRAFAETAIQNGVQELCVTDHMPLKGRCDGDRIPFERVGEYCDAVHALAEEYRGKLTVKLGIEIDYHPAVADEIEDVLKQGSFDWILGSSHLHAIPCADIFRHVSTHREYAAAMYENTISAARSGYFHAIAHVDMYRWIFSLPNRFPLKDDDFREEDFAESICRTLEEIKANGLRLELNPHFAVSAGTLDAVYPSRGITELALQMGIPFSYGSDAHVAEQVGIHLSDLCEHPVYGQALQTWEEAAL